ncbi:hypothetical protein [Mesorhizobium sp. KR1-2]|uniref:hypothetical protein n=1 Tax=Mesorhizobium sp. KR1-2 TaxID=3156609 RepID=UPI0032B3979B
MKLKLAFATATAIGLLMGGAMAGGNNWSSLIQTGNSNTGKIDQSGTGNNTRIFQGKAGAKGNHNEATVTQNGEGNSAGVRPFTDDNNERFSLFQYGDYNKLGVTQTGNGNNVGWEAGNSNNPFSQQVTWDAAGDGPGVKQTGNKNELTIDQNAVGYVGGNMVGNVRQTGSPSASALTNSLKIDQKARGNYVGFVKQNNNGSGTDAAQANKITITQNGNAGNGRNHIYNVTQIGTVNTIGVEQVGEWNQVRKAEQDGSGNKITLSLTGRFNGATRNESGASLALMNGAGAAGASASQVVQRGNDNIVGYSANGNDNAFGFYQNNTGGSGNVATNISINGDRNHLGVYQNGQGNQLKLADIRDSDNVLGIKQTGDFNVASVDMSGNMNGGFSGFTSGGAAGVLAASPLANGRLTAGLLVQQGNGNDVSLTVSGGSNNVFASLQDNGATGTRNTITATQTGSSNQAAVIQLGNMNTSVVSQVGNQNNASISQ